MSHLSVVNETGELVETISEAEARRLTTEARNEFGSARQHFERAWSLIEQAVNGGGHVALGYASPGAYLHAEFDGVLTGLDVPARRLAVRSMTDWGLSTRAIAKPLGVSQKTVVKDSQVIPEVSPDRDSPEPVAAGDDGEPQGAEAPADAAVEHAGTEGSVHPVPDPRPAEPPAVTGIDGKTYKRPTKPKTETPKSDPHDATAAQQQIAEDNSNHLTKAIRYLLTLAQPAMRENAVKDWEAGQGAVPPGQRGDVRPDQMRRACDALHDLADLWENRHA